MEFHLRTLTCCLYTLSENHTVFKKFKVKNDVLLNRYKKDYLFSNKESLQELFDLLNNSSLRKFAFRLLKPLLNKDFFSESGIKKCRTLQKEFYDELTLLKRYLRKFKYNYYRHFSLPNGNYDYFSSEKEINTFAIKLLFLIVGV